MFFADLAQNCAPDIGFPVLYAIVKTESGFNPYAIGVVNGRLSRQPRNLQEAVATALALEQAGANYSLGLGQINKINFQSQGLSIESAFEPCKNLQATQNILKDCYTRALRQYAGQSALEATYSCYYSGNFTTGFKANSNGNTYVGAIAQNTPQSSNSSDITIILSPPKTTEEGKTEAFITIPATDGTVIPIDSKLPEQPGSNLQPERKPPESWDVFGDFTI